MVYSLAYVIVAVSLKSNSVESAARFFESVVVIACQSTGKKRAKCKETGGLCNSPFRI